MLPPQLKRISVTQKQMCGCECCTIVKMLHECLSQFHKKQIQIQRKESRSTIMTRTSSNDSSNYQEYRNEILSDNSLKFSTPHFVIESMTCKNPHCHLPMWKCVMGRCNNCPNPSIPYLETMSPSPLSNISYGCYKLQSRCKMHGPLDSNKSVCSKCDDLIKKKLIEVPEKISEEKR